MINLWIKKNKLIINLITIEITINNNKIINLSYYIFVHYYA